MLRPVLGSFGVDQGHCRMSVLSRSLWAVEKGVCITLKPHWPISVSSAL